jgi:hypothetical protein
VILGLGRADPIQAKNEGFVRNRKRAPMVPGFSQGKTVVLPRVNLYGQSRASTCSSAPGFCPRTRARVQADRHATQKSDLACGRVRMDSQALRQRVGIEIDVPLLIVARHDAR